MRFSLRHIAVIKLAGVVLGLTCLPLTWALLLFFGPDLWVIYHLFCPKASGIVRTYTRFLSAHPEVWLTIDDGPDPQDTPRILDLLDEHQAQATFFLIGTKAAHYPDLVAEIVGRGHEIGHHTHTHGAGTFWCLSPGRVRKELDAAMLPLTPIGGRPPSRFRAPVGIKNLFLAAALAQRNLTCMGWTVRSHDSFARDPEKVIRRVLSQVRPGSIILMHEGPSLPDQVRVQAIAGVLAGLSTRGLRCVIPTHAQLR